MRKLTGILALSLMSATIYGSAFARIDSAPMPAPRDPFYGNNLTGSYLASQFAQRHHDWHRASEHLARVLNIMPDDPVLLKKAMVLAMGSGNGDEAIAFATKLNNIEEPNTLNLLFLTAGAFKKQDYQKASDYVDQMPEGGLTDFIAPLLHSWASAGRGEHDINSLTGNTIHVYHAILIADFLKDPSVILPLLQKAQDVPDLPPEDKERIADIYGHIGEKDKALSLYKDVLMIIPKNSRISKKIETLENNQSVKLFDPVESVNEGVARAMYDMAEILYSDYADDSARVFANLALYFDQDMSDATLLLASVTARNNRPLEAINYYRSITKDSKYFLEARRQAANLLEESERYDDAIIALDELAREYDDLESLIRIGDIYRRNEDFKKSLVTYNQAARKLGKAIPDDYWYLHYVRGMSYERMGEWEKAEKDLKAALAMQPNHPYILNYLGYAWADRGDNLKESLALVQKAAALQPTDGYIADSLGWVYFKMGRFENAVPHLEKAVELLPYDPVINDHLGDAYWRVNRKLEAKFQWERARNHSKDDTLVTALNQKLLGGLLDNAETLKEARREHKEEADTHP